jgi:hypothetical protein
MDTKPGTGEPVTPAAAAQPTLNDSFNQLDMYAERLRVALPLAPVGLLEGYMKWAPWVAIVVGALGIIFSIIALFASTIISGLLLVFAASGTGFALVLNTVVALISAVLELIGGLQMQKRALLGWWLLAFGLVVGFLSSLVHGSILTLIIIAAIAYIHLEVKPNYR